MRRSIRSVAAAIVAAFALAGPASAAMTVETTFLVDEFQFPTQRCGYSWVGDVRLERLVQVRTRDAVTPPTVIENYELTVVWTDVNDPEHGYRVHTQGQARDVPVRLVEGTVWEFEWTDIGRPFQILTSDDRLVMHDRGQLSITSLRDTLGDADPGNDVWLEDTDFGTKGKFPSLELDLCEVFLEAAAG
jgi:hypothetical protein